MRRAAAYHKECILMELILACIFIAPPPVLTVLNVRSLFAKKAFFSACAAYRYRCVRVLLLLGFLGICGRYDCAVGRARI